MSAVLAGLLGFVALVLLFAAAAGVVELWHRAGRRVRKTSRFLAATREAYRRAGERR